MRFAQGASYVLRIDLLHDRADCISRKCQAAVAAALCGVGGADTPDRRAAIHGIEGLHVSGNGAAAGRYRGCEAAAKYTSSGRTGGDCGTDSLLQEHQGGARDVLQSKQSRKPLRSSRTGHTCRTRGAISTRRTRRALRNSWLPFAHTPRSHRYPACVSQLLWRSLPRALQSVADVSLGSSL